MENKLIKKFISILCVIIYMVQSHACNAQNQMTFRYGVLNQLPSSLPAELSNNYQTSSNTFEIIYDRSIPINENYNINIGLGFSVFRFSNSNLFFYGKKRQSNYVIFKYGLGRKIYAEKLFINLDILHYILAHKKKQDDDQRRIFTNIEIGMSYKINNNFKITISSPLTLYPMFLLRIGKGNTANNEPVIRYNSKVRNYGLNFGCTYIF